MKEGKCAETIGAGAATEPDLVASCIGYRIYIYIYTYTYYDEFPKGWSCFSSEGCFLKIKKQETCNINVQVAPWPRVLPAVVFQLAWWLACQLLVQRGGLLAHLLEEFPQQRMQGRHLIMDGRWKKTGDSAYELRTFQPWPLTKFRPQMENLKVAILFLCWFKFVKNHFEQDVGVTLMYTARLEIHVTNINLRIFRMHIVDRCWLKLNTPKVFSFVVHVPLDSESLPDFNI